MWNSFADAAAAAANMATPLKGIADSVQASASKVLDQADSFVADSLLGGGEGNTDAESGSGSDQGDTDTLEFDVEDEDTDGNEGGGDKITKADSRPSARRRLNIQGPKTPKPASPAPNLAPEEELLSLRQEKSILQNLIEKSQGEVAELKSRLQEHSKLEDESEKLRAKVVKMSLQLEDLRKQGDDKVAKKKSGSANTDTEHPTSNSSNTELSLQTKLAEAQMALLDTRTESNRRIEELTKQLEDADARASSLAEVRLREWEASRKAQEVEEVKPGSNVELDKARAEITALKEAADETSSELDALRTSHEEELVEKEKRLAQLLEDARHSVKSASLKAHKVEMEKALASCKEEQEAALEEERSSHNSKFRVLEAEVAAQAAELEGLQADLTKTRSELLQVREDAANKKDEDAALHKAEVESLQGKIDLLVKKEKDAKEAQKLASAEVTTLKGRIEMMSTDEEESREKALQALQDKHARDIAEIEQKHATALEAAAAKSSAELEGLQADLTKTRSELLQVREDAANKKDEDAALHKAEVESLQGKINLLVKKEKDAKEAQKLASAEVTTLKGRIEMMSTDEEESREKALQALQDKHARDIAEIEQKHATALEAAAAKSSEGAKDAIKGLEEELSQVREALTQEAASLQDELNKMNTKLKTQEEESGHERVALEKMLEASKLEAKMHIEEASKQQAQHENIAREAQEALASNRANAESARLAIEAEFDEKLKAIKVDHDEYLSSLEAKHKDALNSSKIEHSEIEGELEMLKKSSDEQCEELEAKLRDCKAAHSKNSEELRKKLEASEASRIELSSALEKSASDAAKVAKDYRADEELALRELQDQLVALKESKREADNAEAAAVASCKHAKSERNTISEQLEKKSAELLRAHSQLAESSKSFESQASEIVAINEKLRKSNAIAMSHKRSLDAAQAAHLLETSKLKALLDSKSEEAQQRVVELKKMYASEADSLRAEAQRMVEAERLKFTEIQKNMKTEAEALAASSVADAADAARAKAAAEFGELRNQQELEARKRSEEEVKAAHDAAVEATNSKWEKKMRELQTSLQRERDHMKEKNDEWTAKEKEWRAKEKKWEALESSPSGKSTFDHHVVGIGNIDSGLEAGVRGRTSTNSQKSFRSDRKTADPFDPELGKVDTISAVSKDKRHRVKPLTEALKSAMLRLPKQTRQGLLMYLIILHLLLFVLLVWWSRSGGGNRNAASEQSVVNPIIAHG